MFHHLWYLLRGWWVPAAGHRTAPVLGAFRRLLWHGPWTAASQSLIFLSNPSRLIGTLFDDIFYWSILKFVATTIRNKYLWPLHSFTHILVSSWYSIKVVFSTHIVVSIYITILKQVFYTVFLYLRTAAYLEQILWYKSIKGPPLVFAMRLSKIPIVRCYILTIVSWKISLPLWNWYKVMRHGWMAVWYMCSESLVFSFIKELRSVTFPIVIASFWVVYPPGKSRKSRSLPQTQTSSLLLIPSYGRSHKRNWKFIIFESAVS